MTPKVSVIMPVYQVERYLSQSLRSVREQSLREIEIICVDDGGQDGCPAMLDRAAAEDPRVRVIHQENHGYGYSVNVGFRGATGDYLAIFEPDDLLPPDALKTLYDLATESGADLVKGDYCQMRESPAQGRRLIPARLHPDEGLYGAPFRVEDRPEALMSQIINCTGIFRRRVLLERGVALRETPGASYQDIGLFFAQMLCARSILYTHAVTYWYRDDNPAASTKSRGKLYAAEQEYQAAQARVLAESDDKRLLAASWSARWRGALGTFARIDPSLYPEFLGYLRPVMEEAWAGGLLRKAYSNAYQWRLLSCFRKSDQAFLGAFSRANGRYGDYVRLFWRFVYDGVPATARFLKEKRQMQKNVCA